MKYPSEVFWWSLFSAGGVLSALFVPVMVLATAFIVPRGASDPVATWERVHGVVGWWPVRLVLFGILAFSLIHCGHRIKHILMDLGLRRLAPVLSFVCYGSAFAGVAFAGYVLVTL